MISGAAYTLLKIHSAEASLLNKVETISQVHSLAVSYPLWTIDIDGLNRSIQTIALHPEIVCVDVSEIDHAERYQWPFGCLESSDENKVLSKVLFLHNLSVGKMDLYYTSLPQREALKRELLTGVMFFFLLMSFAGVIAYLTLQFTVGRPIKRLMASIKKAEHTKVFEAASWSTQDELGNVILAYNNMINQIDQKTDELVAARQQAETAAYTKSRFLANMSHELRTPLNAVIGITEMLREEAEDEHNDTEPYDRVAMSGRHLLKLIDDILDFSKLEAGKITIAIEEIELEELLEEVFVTVAPMAQGRGNRLELGFTGTPAKMMSDPLRLRQILINLLGNACKFTKDGKIILEVDAHNIDGKEGVRFSVRDTGIGISEEQRERLFSDFFQADISTTRQYGGTGLGLAISQRLCRLLGGEISLKSAIGEGAEFSFTLQSNIH